MKYPVGKHHFLNYHSKSTWQFLLAVAENSLIKVVRNSVNDYLPKFHSPSPIKPITKIYWVSSFLNEMNHNWHGGFISMLLRNWRDAKFLFAPDFFFVLCLEKLLRNQSPFPSFQVESTCPVHSANDFFMPCTKSVTSKTTRES